MIHTQNEPQKTLLKLLFFRTVGARDGLVRFQAGQWDVGHVTAAAKMSLRAPEGLPVPKLLLASSLPAAGQGVAVQQSLFSPLLLVVERGNGGLGRGVRAQARWHPTVVGVAQHQTLLGAHLCGLH